MEALLSAWKCGIVLPLGWTVTILLNYFSDQGRIGSAQTREVQTRVE